MWYWIIMIVLIVGIIGMLAVSFGSIKKSRAAAADRPEGDRRKKRVRDADPDAGVTSDDSVRKTRRRSPKEDTDTGKRQKRKKKRQWKILMEDIDSWDKYSFTFYDIVGIGRGKDGSMYERYLPLKGDGRISKVHCAIVHRGDKLYLRDEGSRNGTYLNGERIDRPVVLQRDDIIGVGETRLEIQKILRESRPE